MVGTAGFLFLLGGLVQINPIWLWGPYHTYSSTNGAQPDWYLGWLIGALRLVPGFDLTIGHYTLVPGPFWGGVAFPLVVFGFLYLWPWLERRFTGDDAFHNLLDRPRDAPVRTAIGVGDGQLGVPRLPRGILRPGQRHLRDRLRVPDLGLPRRRLGAAGALRAATWWICRELQASEVVVRERHSAEAEARLERMRHGDEPPGDPGTLSPNRGLPVTGTARPDNRFLTAPSRPAWLSGIADRDALS